MAYFQIDVVSSNHFQLLKIFNNVLEFKPDSQYLQKKKAHAYRGPMLIERIEEANIKKRKAPIKVMTVASNSSTSCIIEADNLIINPVAYEAAPSVIPSKHVCKFEIRIYFYIISYSFL